MNIITFKTRELVKTLKFSQSLLLLAIHIFGRNLSFVDSKISNLEIQFYWDIFLLGEFMINSIFVPFCLLLLYWISNYLVNLLYRKVEVQNEWLNIYITIQVFIFLLGEIRLGFILSLSLVIFLCVQYGFKLRATLLTLLMMTLIPEVVVILPIWIYYVVFHPIFKPKKLLNRRRSSWIILLLNIFIIGLYGHFSLNLFSTERFNDFKDSILIFVFIYYNFRILKNHFRQIWDSKTFHIELSGILLLGSLLSASIPLLFLSIFHYIAVYPSFKFFNLKTGLPVVLITFLGVLILLFKRTFNLEMNPYNLFYFFGLSIIVFYQLLKYENEFYDLNKKIKFPLKIAIAGNSSTGKDQLMNSFSKLFQNQTTCVLGDDYHYWERYEPMWKIQTHLNPLSNNLQKAKLDLIELFNGNAIWSRHYDHTNGKFTELEKINTSDVIIYNGLHSLYDQGLNELFDVKIFLYPQEEIRLSLKISRDTKKRGKTEKEIRISEKQRKSDFESYILPQKTKANIIFSLFDIQTCQENSKPMLDEVNWFNVGLSVLIPSSIVTIDLLQSLSNLGGLSIERKNMEDLVELKIIGNINAVTINLIANTLIPDVKSFFGVKGEWDGGQIGLMQLFTLYYYLNKNAI